MKKKLKVLIPIWLVGVILIYLLVNMLACRWLARQLIPAEMGYLERLGSRLAHIEECERVEPMEGSHVSEFILAVNMRAAMSDFFIGADEISSEHVSYFTSREGDFPLSHGCWICVSRGDLKGEGEWMEDEIAIVNVQDCIDDGYAQELFDFVNTYEDGKLRLDKYAIKDNVFCIPLHISLINQGECIREIEAGSDRDLTGYEICQADTIWMSAYHMRKNVEYALKNKDEAVKFAQKVKDQMVYSDEFIRDKYVRMTPFMYAASNWGTLDGYGLISTTVVRLNGKGRIFGHIAAFLWSLVMLIVSVVVICKDNKKKKTVEITEK